LPPPHAFFAHVHVYVEYVLRYSFSVTVSLMNFSQAAPVRPSSWLTADPGPFKTLPYVIVSLFVVFEGAA
jgi:hypothetical protein